MAAHDNGLSPMGEVVRRSDRNRFIAILLSDPAHRETFFALTAFHIELANIRTAVTEPRLGFIRLQWWRERVEEMAAGQAPPGGQPALGALWPIISEQELPAGPLLKMIDAREAEYADDPLLGLDDFEGFSVATSGALAGLMAHVERADAPTQLLVSKLGSLYGQVAMVSRGATQAARSRHYLPKQLVQKAGISTRAPLNPTDPQVCDIVEVLCGEITHKLQYVKADLQSVARQVSCVVPLWCITVKALNILRKTGYNTADSRVMTARAPIARMALSRLINKL